MCPVLLAENIHGILPLRYGTGCPCCLRPAGAQNNQKLASPSSPALLFFANTPEFNFFTGRIYMETHQYQLFMCLTLAGSGATDKHPAGHQAMLRAPAF
jgi:hypothetical protein